MVNTCLQFDGVNDYVGIGSPANLMALTYPLTFEFWAKPNTLAQNAVILHFLPTDANSNLAIGFYTTLDKIFVGRVTYKYGLSGISTYLTAEQWQHWVIVFTDTTHISFYLDGEEQTLSDVFNYWSATGANIRIGERADTESFEGSIDEVRIYNRALGIEEIKKHYALKFS